MSLLLLPFILQAQGVRGTVRDSAGRPVALADVIVDPGGTRARTDSSGRFAVRGLRPGSYTLRVRKIEYRPYSQVIDVRPNAPLDLRVPLTRLPPLLTAVTATVDANACAPSSLDGFECRRLAGVGMFRDAGEIRALRPEHWADMFDGMPGLRRVMVLGPNGREWRIEAQPSRCLKELWNGQPPMVLANDGYGGFPPDMVWRPIDVVAIEFYDAYAKIPARYRGYVETPGEEGCQLVIYWLRGAAKRE